LSSDGTTRTPNPKETSTNEPAKTSTNEPTVKLTTTETPMPTISATKASSNQLGGSNVTPITKSEDTSEKEFDVPAPLLDFLANPRITDFDEFSYSVMMDWDYGRQIRAYGGAVQITGEEYWSSIFHWKETISEGEGVIILYKYDTGTEFEFTLPMVTGEIRTTGVGAFIQVKIPI
jgi:hypothetical protein